MCCLRSVGSFLGVFPSDLLLQQPIARSGTLIVISDPHTESGSHWLGIHLQFRSHSSLYFDSYGLSPFIPSIQSFLHRNSIVRNYNTVQLQGFMSTVCGMYCCLFALYRDRGNTPSSSGFLLRRQLTWWSRTCSPPNSDPCVACPGECCCSRSTRYVC